MKPPTPSRATDALIEDEKQNGKQKKEKRKKEWVPNQTTLVASYDLHVSYGWLILKKPCPQGELYLKWKKKNGN